MATERLQKLLAQAGVASRRAAEAMIVEGRVRVNGRVVTVLGTKADLHRDRIEVDGKRVVAEKPAYYLLHKPREVVTTLDDPEGRESIAGLLRGVPERVFPVGRLDYHTSGVLLVTNDGAMAQALLHPRKGVPKIYVVKVKGKLDVPQLDQLRNGVDIGNDETTRKAEVFVLREEADNTWVQITITEGKNRQIHRMMEAIGLRVSRLARTGFAGLNVEGLRPGEFRSLTSTELARLKRDYLNPARRARADEARRDASVEAMGEEADSARPDDRPTGGGRGRRTATRRPEGQGGQGGQGGRKPGDRGSQAAGDGRSPRAGRDPSARSPRRRPDSSSSNGDLTNKSDRRTPNARSSRRPKPAPVIMRRRPIAPPDDPEHGA
ncbi:MAG: pseudouridine synthase [Myxococcales bacterium]|nr:pseudouridine synthase [Myxococcales bacterium]